LHTALCHCLANSLWMGRPQRFFCTCYQQSHWTSYCQTADNPQQVQSIPEPSWWTYRIWTSALYLVFCPAKCMTAKATLRNLTLRRQKRLHIFRL
jgi:hypothetical protein